MTREEFLKLIGAGALAASAMLVLGGCSSGSTTPDDVDFTIDISQSPNDDLKTIGGYIIKNNIIVAHTINDTFVAVSSICTHQGGTLEYKSDVNLFHCPNHDSRFNIDGSVKNGPATKSVTQYNVSVNGNIIRIYS